MISDIYFSVTRSRITYVTPNDQDQSLIFKIFSHKISCWSCSQTEESSEFTHNSDMTLNTKK